MLSLTGGVYTTVGLVMLKFLIINFLVDNVAVAVRAMTLIYSFWDNASNFS